MNALMFEPLLRDATIKAIDAVAKKFAGAQVTTENMATNLLNRWNALTRDEKERAAVTILAVATGVVTAVAALKGRGKKTKKVKKAVKKAARKISG
jgi:hypothetical protein